MKIENVAIASLVFDPNNSRKHPQKNLDAIKGSLTKFGQQKPIIIDAKNIIIAGNGTVAAAKELGWSTINAVRSELTGFMQTAFALADNRTAELAEWDFDILKESLNALDFENFDIAGIGFTEADLDFFGDNSKVGENGKKSQNKELSADEFSEFDHQCPRCGFEFDDGTKSESAPDRSVETD
jgi:ParB-like chromosome segregation protein Spo0J